MATNVSLIMPLPGEVIAALVVALFEDFSRSFGTPSNPLKLRAARTAAAKAFNAKFVADIGKTIVPAIARRIPVRTGRLRTSFRMSLMGNNALRFDFRFYGRFAIVGSSGGKISVPDLVFEEIIRHAPLFLDRAGQAGIDAAEAIL